MARKLRKPPAAPRRPNRSTKGRTTRKPSPRPVTASTRRRTKRNPPKQQYSTHAGLRHVGDTFKTGNGQTWKVIKVEPFNRGQELITAERIAKPPRRLANPKRRRNSEPTAAGIFEAFHGQASSKTKEYEVTEQKPAELADLGRLVELRVTVRQKNGARRKFDLHGFSNTRLACTPDGGQLYFVAGYQNVDLAAIGLAHLMPKDHIEIGPCTGIVYDTRKHFHNFEKLNYDHRFGEDGGHPPTLNYDVHSKLLYLTGGTYQVRPEGIVR